MAGLLNGFEKDRSHEVKESPRPRCICRAIKVEITVKSGRVKILSINLEEDVPSLTLVETADMLVILTGLSTEYSDDLNGIYILAPHQSST